MTGTAAWLPLHFATPALKLKTLDQRTRHFAVIVAAAGILDQCTHYRAVTAAAAAAEIFDHYTARSVVIDAAAAALDHCSDHFAVSVLAVVAAAAALAVDTSCAAGLCSCAWRDWARLVCWTRCCWYQASLQ